MGLDLELRMAFTKVPPLMGERSQCGPPSKHDPMAGLLVGLLGEAQAQPGGKRVQATSTCGVLACCGGPSVARSLFGSGLWCASPAAHPGSSAGTPHGRKVTSSGTLNSLGKV